MKKRRGSNKFCALYADELTHAYKGDEEFMNTMHPFEESGQLLIKKSSPIQKAIIACIKNNGGSASEGAILKYITEKWDIINKYTERGFMSSPSLRVVRLNCGVKKKARRLFLKDPDHENCWILNSAPRKIPVQRNCDDSDVINDDDIEFETINRKIRIDNKEIIMNSGTFEFEVEKFVRSCCKPLTTDEICNNMKMFCDLDGIFSALPYERRVRAILVVLKNESAIVYDEINSVWVSKDYIERKAQTIFDKYKISRVTLDEFYKLSKNFSTEMI